MKINKEDIHKMWTEGEGDHNSLIHCMEEFSELVQAISKLIRWDEKNEDEIFEFIENIVEEMADAHICLAMIQDILFINDIEMQNACDEKMKRNLERIGLKCSCRECASEATESRSDYEKAVEGMINHCSEVLLSKHAEYATEDDFHNFNVAASIQNITPEQALIGMMDKHVVSVHDLVNEAAEGKIVPVEVWKEKIGDNINYLLLLWAMVSRG